MKTEVDTAKQAIQDKIASQLKTVEAKLDVLKARAEAAKGNAELKAVTKLLSKNQLIQRKLHKLKKSGQDRWEEARGDLEAQVADFEKSVRGIESKVKSR